MMHRGLSGFPGFSSPHALFVFLLFVTACRCAAAELDPAAAAGFDTYVRSVELRLAQQHESPDSFLAPFAATSQSESSLRGGELTRRETVGETIIDRLTPSAGIVLPGATLYHWRGTAFAPGAKAADFERLMKDFNSYPQHFSPQVLDARVLARDGDHLQASMRVRQQHVLTVVLDTTYDITYGRLDAQHGYSIARSTRIAEIAVPGTRAEHALGASEEHGFLWRQNTYWSYEERDGGLYMQIESVSLTRAIPTGLGWAIGPYAESIPRQSLRFTLRAVCKALQKH